MSMYEKKIARLAEYLDRRAADDAVIVAGYQRYLGMYRAAVVDGDGECGGMIQNYYIHKEAYARVAERRGYTREEMER